MNALKSKLLNAALAAAVAFSAIPAQAQIETALHEATHESPALFEGLWCGTGLLRGGSLELSQHRAKFEGMLRYRNRERPVKGDIEGRILRTFTEKAGELVLELQGAQLRIQQAGGNLVLARGQSFVRASAGSCV
ncbi:hypothetical protein GHT07_11415 [Caenimonas koreensis DSM 17982]|uniref:Protease inhibitor Inh n=1 Tax=Caenimonas koreensis DSM 17982 TaxID=1121255 RepID=A0A844B8E9_9BURK|nr:hypothetical protein [Caenimonas koreensis]MRD47889.1 hypothetical protein [Caenimonas koreensis DSM 17982]